MTASAAAPTRGARYTSTTAIASALTRYRVMAVIVSVSLVLFCIGIPLQAAGSDALVKIVGIIHGWIFFPLYVVASFDLSPPGALVSAGDGIGAGCRRRTHRQFLCRATGTHQRAGPARPARHHEGLTMDQVSLGGLQVSAQGLGCMGMSEWYGETDWDEAMRTLHRALDLGVTFLDTANVYGDGHNEVLVGRAIVGRRDEVQLATKFGIDRTAGFANRKIRGAHDYVKSQCDSSLLRLGVDHIDLYYLHRPPDDVEIEETVGAMAELVDEGKVGHLGLSEVDEPLLRRAHAVHPIAAVQSEYSLWTRDPEVLAPVMAELGVGLVPFSPLGRGYLTGTVDTKALGPKDFRANNPRFAGDANEAVADTVRRVAARLGAEPAQIALAWVSQQSSRLGIPVAPIPGTKRVKWLEQNVGALDLVLDDEALAELDLITELVVGGRY